MGKQLALSFDDGPNTDITVQVLDILEKYGVVASFFLIADNITEESKESVKRAYAMGCDIENHSRTHKNMTELSAEEIKEEIKYCSNAIYDIVGEYPTFFRPPFILVNKTMADNIDLPFICGTNGLDWEPSVKADERARLIIEGVDDGHIILLHDMTGNDETVKALDVIIPTLLKQGYEFVTVPQLFKNKGVVPNVHTGQTYSCIFAPEERI